MSTPKVYNKLKDSIPSGAVYIGRPSKWGNPFMIGVHGDRQAVVDHYRSHLQANPELMAAAQKELKGKNLVCFCKPLACHGDVLLEVANPTEAAA